ncbi:MAG: hypothetical protein ABI661_00670 [Gammaproteobacteria bacterium]
MNSLLAKILRAGASPRARWRLQLAAVALVVLQVAAVSHLVGHSAAGGGAECAICLAATGSGNAIPAAAVAVATFQATTSEAVEFVASSPSIPSRASYRARAPPVSV